MSHRFFKLCSLVTLCFSLLAISEADSQVVEAIAETATPPPCRLSLHAPGEIDWRGPRSRGYEADAAAVHREYVGFEVRNSGASCGYQVDVVPAGSDPRLVSARATLDFSLSADDGAQGTNMLSFFGRFHNSGGVSFSGFVIDIPSAQHVPAGVYATDLDVTLLKIEEGLLTVEDTRRIRLGTEVWPRVAVSIGESAGAGITSRTVDMGNLQSGAERRLDFSVYANSDYTLSFQSENDMKLKHEKADIYIPYGLTLDGKAIAQRRMIEGDTIRHGMAGRLHDFRVTIGRLNVHQPAGHYSDRLLVTVRSEQ